jgi:hypothetical protein
MARFLRSMYDQLMFRPHPEHGVIRQLEGERQWWMTMCLLGHLFWGGLFILVTVSLLGEKACG